MPDLPITLLGYSLGSGIAASVVLRVNADRLILCAGFTSFRKAAQSIGFPKFLAMTLPDLWLADENLRHYRAPVLIVHGERDELFPVAMAEELASYCASELIVVPGMTHNQPFYAPDIAYWGLVLSHLPSAETKDSDAANPAPGGLRDRSEAVIASVIEIEHTLGMAAKLNRKGMSLLQPAQDLAPVDAILR